MQDTTWPTAGRGSQCTPSATHAAPGPPTNRQAIILNCIAAQWGNYFSLSLQHGNIAKDFFLHDYITRAALFFFLETMCGIGTARHLTRSLCHNGYIHPHLTPPPSQNTHAHCGAMNSFVLSLTNYKNIKEMLIGICHFLRCQQKISMTAAMYNNVRVCECVKVRVRVCVCVCMRHKVPKFLESKFH